jgi:transposase-like protein
VFGATVLAARLLWVIGTMFVMHFSLSAMTNYAAAARFGYLLIITEPGASVAEVAREHGVNAIQVFKWRRASDPGELIEARVASAALLPATLKFVES